MKKKTISIFVLVVIFIVFLMQVTYAVDLGLEDNLNLYKGGGDNTTSKQLVNKAEVIVSAIQVIGIVLSVIMLMVIGIKYMVGSVEEKAEYKKTLVPYVVGALLLFTGSLIPQIIYKFMQNF